MRQNRSVRRSPVVPILVAGGIGYLLAGWHVTGLRSTDLSAAQSVAQRFPDDWQNAHVAAASIGAAPSVAMASAMVVGSGDGQLALLSPEPMVMRPSTTPQRLPQQPAMQLASAEDGSPAASDAASQPVTSATPNAHETKPAQKPRDAKPVATLVDRRTERPGFVLNEAQIASIKRRLNLTPDQERMWPAVEVALRGLSYTHDARGRGTNAAGATQLAAADPDSAEVQNLKSAVTPLILSFNEQQKDEVRNIAHVMGLDQLASQF